ncbi:MAG: esterase [Lachnospiraceae bacterium]|nr:esterase [Lachnospiraceae bacterium]
MSLKVFDERIKVYGDTSKKVCVILVGEDPEKEAQIISEGENRALTVFLKVDDWNNELSPWNAPPAFGNEPFGNGADNTLDFITGELIPFIDESFGAKDYLLAGYSLAGLFALYGIYKSSCFAGAIAVSPSVWFPGWPEFIKDKMPNASFVYLSLGNKEEKTRNAVMAGVGDNIRHMHEILIDKGFRNILEWNDGGHFKDPELRLRKGIASGLDLYENR